MDNRNDIREFLASRRSRITPQQAGLPAFGSNRLVPGLRREEVALLAGVSIDYYTRLERGNLNGVSESVLDAVAGVLQLDEAERAHLFDLARAANTTLRTWRRPAQQRVRPSVQRILDAMTGAPAYVRNGRRDILAANQLGHALLRDVHRFASTGEYRPIRVSQLAGTYLLPPLGERGERHRGNSAHRGRPEPYDRGLMDLVGELSTRSEEFRTRWASHNVRFHRTGIKDIHHPVVGDLHLAFEAMDLPADPGLSLVVYSAEPGSAAEDGLKLLASWAATLDQADRAETADVKELRP